MTTYLQDRETDSFNKLCSIVQDLKITAPIIFDVGANIGQSITLFRKAFSQSTIHSFEPNPETFITLEKNWGHDKAIFLHPKALNSKTGTVPFFVTNVSEASSFLLPHPKLIKLSSGNKYDSKKIEVEGIILDQFCMENGIAAIDVLKLDVQGAELEVLKGAERLLGLEAVSLLYVEMNFAETYSNQVVFEDFLVFCVRYGYKLWDISPFLYTRTGRLWYANTIFLSNKAMAAVETNLEKSGS